MTTTAAPYVGRYTCPACPARFVDLADKRHHIRTTHPGGQAR